MTTELITTEFNEQKIERSENESANLIFLIRDFLSEGLNNENLDWAENLSCALIGLMIGKNRYIKDQLGEIRANIISIMIGASRLANKTIPLKKARKIAKALVAELNKEILRQNGYTPEKFAEAKKSLSKAGRKTKESIDLKQEIEDTESQLLHYILPETFSTEGLLNVLSKDENKVGILFSDEFTSLVKGAKNKDYMETLFETFSRMYDNELESEATISRGFQDAGTIHVSIVSATTPYLFKVLDDGFFEQGTGNRILWIIGQDLEEIDVEKEMEKAFEFYYSEGETEELLAKEKEILHHLMKIESFPKGIVQPDFAGGAKLFRHMKESRNKAIQILKQSGSDNPEPSLIGGLNLNAHKLALIHCFGRCVMSDNTDTMERPEITLEDAEWAIAKTEKHYEHYKKLLDLAFEHRALGGYNNYSKEVDHILRLIDRKGGRLSKTDFTNNCKWAHRQKVIDLMFEGHIINVIQERGTTFYTRYKEPTLSTQPTGLPVDLTKLLPKDIKNIK